MPDMIPVTSSPILVPYTHVEVPVLVDKEVEVVP